MASFKSWVYSGCIFIICSQLLHYSSAEDQQLRNQPSKITDADVSKPFTWTLPAPKPEVKKGHKEGARAPECHCNCNCDCKKTQCKDEGREKGGPVVCMPMECDNFGCKVGGGVNVEANNNFHIPYFTVASRNPQPQGKTQSSDTMNMTATAAGHH